MAAVRSRKDLVIDACVASAAGGPDAVHPVSTSCRDSLIAVYDDRHRMVMSPDIKKEWDILRSKFARSWRLSMFRRNLVKSVDPPAMEDTWNSVARTISDPTKKAAAKKDFHLIRAAIETDRVVISLDEKSRQLFASASSTVSSLGKIVWANPSVAKEKVVSWIKGGAALESSRELSNYST